MTELEPVTLPTAASAVSSPMAAAWDANVSGSDVPSATNVMAVIDGESPIEQPNIDARSAMKMVVRR